MRIKFGTILAFLLFSQVSLAHTSSEIVKQFVEDFNQRNIDSMLAVSSENMRWMRVSGHEIAIETSNLEQLRQAMTGYFNSVPSAKSEIRSIHASGSFVYALEEAFWTSAGVAKASAA